jgi:hypothetical protein
MGGFFPHQISKKGVDKIKNLCYNQSMVKGAMATLSK